MFSVCLSVYHGEEEEYPSHWSQVPSHTGEEEKGRNGTPVSGHLWEREHGVPQSWAPIASWGKEGGRGYHSVDWGTLQLGLGTLGQDWVPCPLSNRQGQVTVHLLRFPAGELSFSTEDLRMVRTTVSASGDFLQLRMSVISNTITGIPATTAMITATFTDTLAPKIHKVTGEMGLP